MEDTYYYRALALAYVRGCHADLREVDDDRALAAARERGVRLHRFKRNAELPRVRRVLGVLKSFAPRTLLDVGSGRGTFLWPLLNELPELQVAAVDVLAQRVAMLDAVARGGVDRLTARQADASALPFADGEFDVVTVLEVLEHVVDPAPVSRELVRVARDAIVATVPAREDDNPEHLRLFTAQSLTALFTDAGARAVRIDYVRDHIVAVVRP